MAYLIVLVAVLARFAPHPPNFSPVYGALLFAGACLKKRDSIWFPVALLAVSDVILTTLIYRMHFGWTDTLDWAAYAAVALIGWWLRKNISLRTVLAGSLAGSTVFFIISNFAVWLGWRMYPPTGAGFVACYVAALPFFGNTLLSSVLFSAGLFGAYEFYSKKADARRLGSSVAHGR
jgi:uncharacterized protein DUF6580